MLKVNVTIEGSCQPTISGDGLSRVFEVASGAQATLNDLFITGGVAKGTTGGGILNDKGATVTLNGGILTGNSAASGGGIYNNGGTVIIEN